MRVSLLTSVDATSHIHLVIGSNPLAAARCSKSLEVGAQPIVIAPETAEIHYGLQKRIDDGEVKWLKKSFEEADLSTLGREEVGGYVDAVFVTSSSKFPQSASRVLCSPRTMLISTRRAHLHPLQETPSSSKRRRLPSTLLILSPIHAHRRPPPNRHHNQRQRLQAILPHPPRNRLFPPTEPRLSLRAPRHYQAAHTGRRPSLSYRTI